MVQQSLEEFDIPRYDIDPQRGKTHSQKIVYENCVWCELIQGLTSTFLHNDSSSDNNFQQILQTVAIA